MNYLLVAFGCCALVLISCNPKKSKEPEMEDVWEARGGYVMPPPSSENEDNSIEAQRLRHIRKVFGKYPKMKLPYHRVTEEQDKIKHPESNLEEDTLVFGADYSTVSIVGTAPDTSNYFGFFYLIHADEPSLSFAAIDKSGHIIERKFLITGNYKGGESDNRSFIDISKDLTIIFDYSEFDYDYESEDNWHIPIAARGHVLTSKITASGKVKEIKRVEKDPAVLLKDPIVH
jgi:hypothetical protein